jgi:hypothetical protein
MNDLICIGGPLHGKIAADIGSVMVCQLPDPHLPVLHVQPHLRECLELKEIRALTGSSGHREPRVIKEHHERQIVLRRNYLKRGYVFRGRMRWAYVFEGHEPKQRELRELLSAAISE